MAEGIGDQRVDRDPPAGVRRLELGTKYSLVESGSKLGSSSIELVSPKQTLRGLETIVSTPFEAGAVMAPYDEEVMAPFSEEIRLDPSKRYEYLRWQAHVNPDLVQWRRNLTDPKSHPDAGYKVSVSLKHPQIEVLEKAFLDEVRHMPVQEYETEEEKMARIFSMREAMLAEHADIWNPYKELRDQLRMRIMLPGAFTVIARRDPREGERVSGILLTSFYPEHLGPNTTARFAPLRGNMARDMYSDEGIRYRASTRAAQMCGESGYELRLPERVLSEAKMEFYVDPNITEGRVTEVLPDVKFFTAP